MCYRSFYFFKMLQFCISSSHLPQSIADSPQSIAEVSEDEFPGRLLRRKIPCW